MRMLSLHQELSGVGRACRGREPSWRCIAPLRDRPRRRTLRSPRLRPLVVRTGPRRGGEATPPPWR